MFFLGLKFKNNIKGLRSHGQGLKFNYSNVFELDLDKQRYVLEKTNVSDIWGIGSGLSNFLVNNKIQNALQLTKFNKDDIGETLLEETGLNIDELAKIEGYKNCIN